MQSIKVEEKVYDEIPYRLRIKSYKGEYRNGLREGKGKIHYENGDWYDGDWLNNNRHGEGTYYYHALQATYTGQWTDGLKNGNGIMELRSDSKIAGIWNEDRLLYT